ncbi:MAG: beta-lactamase family protein [Candidatus Dormibacteraeota bacterium]|nr:beta-lactamase family protein [Candidatus Dormibacteraeota bacterium]MBO0761200.1 beta-lactamase family protein [Candidatus Dormibacteraeota bacterium]
MTDRGLTASGLTRLHEVLATHVDAGHAPGVVFGVSRGEEVHVDAVGAVEPGGPPVRQDAIFRITSMTRPITAVATLLLVERGWLALDEPVDGLLPELAGRRVLRRLDGPVDDTVPARRSITVRDLLSFRAGFGMILAPASEYPILEAEQSLELRSLGPPVPITPHVPDEWMRRMGSLPLMDQPGAQWRYHTGSQILGVLIARASGQTPESFYREHIFDPLGMRDTGFVVPAHDLHRLPPLYEQSAGRLEPFDDGGVWAKPRPFADCGAGLVSTVGDYLSFARMLLARGSHRGRAFLAPELVAAMTTDQLTFDQRQAAGPFLDGRGWGFGLSVIDAPELPGGGPKGYGWSGGFGTVWANDPDADLAAVLCTQVLAGPEGAGVEEAFWAGVYGALER